MGTAWVALLAVPLAVLLPALAWTGPAAGAGSRPVDALGRGVVAVSLGRGQVFVSWRLRAADPVGMAFDVYRQEGGATPVRLNAEPLRGGTWWLDTGARLEQETAYLVRPSGPGNELERGAPFRLPAGASARPYVAIPIQPPAGSTPNDASAGDLDGDGEYELVLKCEQRPRDNASPGRSGQTALQGYRLDGTLLWTIRLGPNIREGAHYTPFLVSDLDGDGRAEVACRTADGTVDGTGRVMGDGAADWRSTEGRTLGKVLAGPEYLTVFDGRTGAALASTNYVPGRGDLGGWGGVGGNGGNDRDGNRADRFLAAVACLDGRQPSLVFCRGYYGRSVLAAWDWRGGRLTQRWVFDSRGRDHPYSGQGGHQLAVADVDGDGRDEIVYHAMVVDDDGRGLYTTGLRHGDALHVGDLDPGRPGLEVFGVHESEEATVRLGTPGTAMFDARTGAILWSHGPGLDVGRGLAADIDPRHWGVELWTGPAGLRTCRGEPLGPAPRTANFALWWDGDLLRELLDGTRIQKWDWTRGALTNLFSAEGCAANNGSKANPCLSADLLGDWREEVVWRSRDNRELRLYTTTLPTPHRRVSLMQDPQYRLGVAWQNVGYNQPPHPGHYLGEGPPRGGRP